MNLLFIESWFPAPLAKAIGWTLVHSLWQGLLLTFVAGILILFTRRSAASIRYKLLSSLLILFVTGAAITFVLEWRSALAASQSIAATVADPVQTPITTVYSNGPVTLVNTSTNSSILNILSMYINQYAPLIVAIWFLIFLFKCLRLTVHIGYAQHLKNYKTTALPILQKRLNELAALVKVKGSIIVRESGIVKVPSVIGFLKPVILLPVGLLSNLPADQVEAILLHELAHIRRKDYLVNILQCLAETIFFFNPSVLWLSSLIRQERENCCDDMAIAVIGKKATYVSALVAFQEYRSDSPYAPAFPGEKYPVLQRVKRIVYNNNKNLNNMEKIFLAGGVALCALLVFTFSSTSAQQAKPINKAEVREATKREAGDKPVSDINAVVNKMTEITKDTVPAYTGTISRTFEDGKNYTVIVKNNVVKGLFIDSERVPDEKFGDYKNITDKLIQDHAIGFEKHKKAEKEKMKYEQAKAKDEEVKQKLKEKLEKQKEKDIAMQWEKDVRDKFDYKGEKEFEYKSKKEFDLKNKKEINEHKIQYEENRKHEMKQIENEHKQNENSKKEEINRIREQYQEYKRAWKMQKSRTPTESASHTNPQ